MALRHLVPKFDPSLLAERADTEVPRYPEPKIVEFRPGGSLAGLLQEVQAQRCVKVVAACGAGKSVKVPAAIAEATSGLVIHSVPSVYMAWALSEYVRTVVNVPVAFVETVDEPLPMSGVVFMSNACLVIRCGYWKYGVVAPPQRVTVALDESHESDCSSGVLRDVVRSFKFIDRVVFLTATPGADLARKREAEGEIIEEQYDPVPVADWDIEQDVGKPWHIGSIDGNALLFIEREQDAQRLHRAYVQCGFLVFRLSARMGLSHFKEAWGAQRDPLRGQVVYLADYSFRSSFTFNVSRVVDPLQVVYNVRQDGVTMRKWRNAYQCEYVQASGRGGRVKGSRCIVSRPKIPLLLMICDQEGTEVDGAAVMFRLLGFKPPRVYEQATPFVEGPVPRDLVEAFSSALAFGSASADVLVSWEEMRAYRPPSPVVRPSRQQVPPRPRSPCGITPYEAMQRRGSAGSVVSVVNVMAPSPVQQEEASPFGLPRRDSVGMIDPTHYMYGGASHKRAPSDASSDRTVELPNPAEYGGRAWESMLTSLAAAVEQQVTPDVLDGETYAYYTGVEHAGGYTAYFREGVASVERMAEAVGLTSLRHVWSDEMRMCATRVVLDEYNECVAHVRALRSLHAACVDVMPKASAYADPVMVYKWVTGLSEENLGKASRAKAMVRLLLALQTGGYTPVGDYVERERVLVLAHLEDLKRLCALVSDGSPEAYRDTLAVASYSKPVNLALPPPPPAVSPALQRLVDQGSFRLTVPKGEGGALVASKGGTSVRRVRPDKLHWVKPKAHGSASKVGHGAGVLMSALSQHSSLSVYSG